MLRRSSLVLALALAALPAAAQAREAPPVLAHELEVLTVKQTALELRLDSAQHGQFRMTKKRATLINGIAVAAYTVDSLKGVEAQIVADLVALGDTAAAHELAPIAPPQVPALPVDSSWKRARTLGTLPYLMALGAGTQLGRLDRDPGGYDRARFYADKAERHAGAGALLELGAEAAGVPSLVALGGTCLAAVGFEYAQGFPNRRDMANGCAGAATSWLWARFWTPRGRR